MDNKNRIDYLDGLRGLCALYIVIYHAFTISGPVQISGSNDFLMVISKVVNQVLLPVFFRHGPLAVPIFIVISGYSLMLPVLADKNFTVRWGFRTFLKRRAIRILPPYYVALAITLLFFLLIPNFNNVTVGPWKDALPALNFQAIGSHLLLVHNWVPDMSQKINPPMWSIAVEWQIYFIFPLLLLPLWKRFGIFFCVCAAFAFGLIPYFLWSKYYYFEHTWFLGLFALGMLGAITNYASGSNEVLKSVYWKRLAIFFFILFCLTTILDFDFLKNLVVIGTLAKFVSNDMEWLKDIIIGLFVTCLLITLSQEKMNLVGKKTVILRLLEHRWIVFLGTFSYSLYLIHDPILALTNLTLKGLVTEPLAQELLNLVFGIPLSLGLAYLFFLLVEAKFLTKNSPKFDPKFSRLQRLSTSQKPTPYERVPEVE